MTRYYRVSLYIPEQKEIYFPNKNVYIICKKFPFSNKIFQEIITGKLIYSNRYQKTLQYVEGFYWGISQSEVEQWLNNLDQVKLKNHINMINTIEEITAKGHEEKNEYINQIKSQEKQAGKTIKRTLRKIKIK